MGVFDLLFQDIPCPSTSNTSTDTEEQKLFADTPTIAMATSPVPATTPRQQKGGGSHAATDNKGSLEVILDFSFLNITEMADLENEEPRACLGKKVSKNKDDKYNCKCLKANNNVITELKGFSAVVERILVCPEALSWVDLSFNELTKIDAVFLDYPCLQILYLHGNSISDIKEVDKLSGVRSLKKLCLHGNPIETTKAYRWYVLTNVPQLHSFDMSGVTKADRATASAWKNTSLNKKKKRRSDND